MAITIDLGPNNNTLKLGDDDYNVTGTDGNNTLTFGNGANTLILGDGSNTLTFADGASQITLGTGNNTVTTGSGSDTITATDGNNTITVGDGNDTVILGNGSDSVTSGNGNSIIVAGNGANNTILVGSGSNQIFLGNGAGAVVHTAAGNNTVSIAAESLGTASILGNLDGPGLIANTLILTTTGAADVAKVSGFGSYNLASGGATALTLTDSNFSRVPGASINVVEVSGGSTVDASTVSAANSVSIYVGSGTNAVTGGAGNDFFFGTPGDVSVVDGGAGYDTMTFSGPASDYQITKNGDVITVTGNNENDTLTSIENIIFNGNLTVALTSDTGFSNQDGITSNASLTGTAEAGTVVSISDENGSIGSTTADDSGAWTYLPLGLADGSHTITVSESNIAGTVSNASIELKLETTAVLTVGLASDTGSSSTDSITSNPVLSGTADAGTSVSISDGNGVVAAVMADVNGAWTYSPTGLADGTQTYTASVTDNAGNTGSTNVTFTLDTAAPTVTLALVSDTGTSSTDGITANNALAGTAEGGSTVTILDGTTVLGTTLAAGDGSWNYTPTGLGDGAHTLTASETDVAGNIGTASVSLTLDTTAPVLTLALQADTGISATDGITNDRTIIGTADGPGTITVSLNGQTIESYPSSGGSQTFSPASLADGTYQVVVSETDSAGNTGTTSLNVTLDTTAPTVTVALAHDSGAPGNSGVTNNDSLAGTAEANSTVTILNGNAVLGTTTVGADGGWSFTPAGLADGNYSLTASETDVAGNTGTGTVAFTLDSAAPTVTAALANDTGPSTHDGITDDASLTGTAAVGSVVTITEGNSVLGSATADTDGNWGFTPPGLADGNHTLTVSQTDTAGHTGTANVGITLITTPPYVTAGLLQDTGTSATDGVTNNDTLIGTANANSAVTILNGTTILGTTLSGADGSWSYTPTGLADGTYNLTTTQTDLAGNTGSAPISFTLDTTLAVVTASLANDTGPSATDSITSNDTLAGTADTGSTVTILNGTTVLGTTVAAADGSWSYMPTGLADGTMTLTASETDVAGNTSSTSVDLTLLTTTPAVTAMLAPGEGGYLSGEGVLAGTAAAGSTVTVLNGTTVLGTTVAGSDGSWNYTAANLADGNYTLTASQSDAAGNTGTASVSFALGRFYTANVNNDDNASNVFIVLDRPGDTANIDLTNNTQPVTVYGGGANMNLTAGNALVVMNGPGQTNATTIHSLGNDFLWGGQSTIDMDGVSGNRMVLSGTGPTSGTLNLNTAGPAVNVIDVWGTTGTTETINNLGTSSTEIFGGRSDIAFSGGNSLIIVNGPDQTGALSVNSTGGNTVWTGSSAVTFNEGTSGDDTVVLSGSGTTLVHGTYAASTGTTTIAEYKGTGQFEYDGGTKAANISIGDEHATVFGGTGNQTMNLNGNGSLIIADSDTVSGLQTVVVAPGSSGSLEFWGGYGSNDAAITLGAGAAFIQAGSGNDTLTGGSGNISLDLAASVNTLVNIDGSKSGTVNVMGYTGSNATLNVTNVDSQAVVGGSLVMHLHDGSSITFQSYVPNANHIG